MRPGYLLSWALPHAPPSPTGPVPVDALRIVLDPAAPFASEAEVEVRVSSATVGGGHALDDVYTFFAEDRTALGQVRCITKKP